MTDNRAIEELQNIANNTGWEERRQACEIAIAAIQERRHGEWLLLGTRNDDEDGPCDEYMCSVCNEVFSTAVGFKMTFPHCFMCGAKMDGGKNHD
jgi:hypothetical protein